MITEVIMPKLGQTMEEGTIERWLKKEGDSVEKGDILLEITTDKATLEVESYGKGVLRKILAREGETVPVTQVIALIADPDEELPEIKPEAAPAAHRPAPPTTPSTSIKASPLARKLAREKGIDLSEIAGSGPGGRITKEDVLKISAEKGMVSLTPMRRAIARAMSESKRNVPHYYVAIEVDMTEALEWRKKEMARIEKETGSRLSISHIILKTTALALKEFPEVNSSWTEGGIVKNEEVIIGIAVGLEEGLIVPILRDVNKKDIGQIASEVDSLAARAKDGKLKAEEYSGATFTISNLGMFGVKNFIPIINQPEAAILGVGTISEKPSVVNGKVCVRSMMDMTLSADHRVVDGLVAARFLQRMKEILENPQLLQ